MKKLFAAFALLALLGMPLAASAANEVDMAKVSCKEFLGGGDESISTMLVWIDGYMSAKSDNTVMSNAWMEKLGGHLGQYCSKNPAKTIMDAIEAMK
ncbi:MAG: hypothetical protein J5846_02965 [Desulfovibrio sp.]|nr:hypothetical protein [Desulfovibrio sp.]